MDDAVAVIPCPFVCAKGKKCSGHVVRIEAFNADLRWDRDDKGIWSFSVSEPRSQYHLCCSESDNHGREDAKALKFYYDELSPELKAAIKSGAGRLV
jgi:hypothetical protein